VSGWSIALLVGALLCAWWWVGVLVVTWAAGRTDYPFEPDLLSDRVMVRCFAFAWPVALGVISMDWERTKVHRPRGLVYRRLKKAAGSSSPPEKPQ
jgi:hypothetical protein